MAKKLFYEGIIEQASAAAANGAMLTVKPDRQYYNTFVSIDTNGQWIDSECAVIAFLNVGDENWPNPTGQDVSILGFKLKPGFGVSFTGEENEVDMTKYQLTFSGTGVKNCWVFRKMYR